MSDTAFRRWLGPIFGLVLGLIYGFTTQYANRFALPGLPLYQPPFGPALNTALSGIIGLVLGWVTGWPPTGAVGWIYGSIVAALFVSIGLLVSGSTPPELRMGKIATTLFMYIPLTGMVAPVLIFFRWTLDKLQLHRGQKVNFFARIWRSVAAVAMALGLGMISYLPPEGREALQRMDALLQVGLQTSSSEALPVPLQAPDVPDFLGISSPNYQLAWESRNLERFAIPRPNRPDYEMSVVVARFDNGRMLACLYAGADLEAECRPYPPLGAEEMP